MGFYFSFTSTFATHCLPIGFVGFLIMLKNFFTHPTRIMEYQLPIVVFAPCNVLAVICFLAHFRRKQANYAKEWGCFAWTASELRTRPTFKGQPKVDPIDGHILTDFSKRRRARRRMVS